MFAGALEHAAAGRMRLHVACRSGIMGSDSLGNTAGHGSFASRFGTVINLGINKCLWRTTENAFRPTLESAAAPAHLNSVGFFCTLA